MPKLVNENDNKKYFNNLLIDKENEDVVYNDEKHLYLFKKDNTPAVSVTQLIGEYCNPFDSEFWSSYKALESIMEDSFWEVKGKLLSTKKFDYRLLDKYKISREEFADKKADILAGYEKNKIESCERGTKIHAQIEQSIYKKDPSLLKKFKLGGELPVFKGDYPQILTPGIYPEYLISYNDGELRLSGQIDLLSVIGNKYIIVDHKSSLKIEFKSYYDKIKKTSQKMKFPLNDLDDVNGQHYTLQLSLYAWMVQKHNPNLECDNLILHWINHDNEESFIEVPYLKEDVERMIKHYKKHSLINKELNKLKPVIV